jgi:hypothetical protein
LKLLQIFGEGMRSVEELEKLYAVLATRNRRAIRSDWARRFHQAGLTKWPQKAGLWRSSGKDILVVGTDTAGVSHEDFSPEALSVLLRSGLVLSMAAVDKVLHEAVAKRFVHLVKKKRLDDLLEVKLSSAYGIAMETRVRKGKGGSIRLRPGPRFKAAVIASLYRETLLSTEKLETFASACGLERVWTVYGKSSKPVCAGATVRRRWSRLYARRNAIAHECNIVRKLKAKKIHFVAVTASELRTEIAEVRAFGQFLAESLDR